MSLDKAFHHFFFSGGGGGKGGSVVLGKLPVTRSPTYLEWVRVGVVWTILLSSFISFFFLPLPGRRPDID